MRKCPLSSIQHGVTHEGKALHLLAPTLSLSVQISCEREVLGGSAADGLTISIDDDGGGKDDPRDEMEWKWEEEDLCLTAEERKRLLSFFLRLFDDKEEEEEELMDATI